MVSEYLATCLMNNNYKSLLTKQRTYAAFNDSTKTSDEITPKKCFGHLSDLGIKEVLDPMAGYGTIMNYGWENSVSTYMVEVNAPAYLWQFLLISEYNDTFINAIDKIIKRQQLWPKATRFFDVTDDWIGEEGIRILVGLFELNELILSEVLDDGILIQKLSLSLLLPFVMRLSAALKGDAYHVKIGGGVAILKDYEKDYEYYLCHILKKRLIGVYEQHRQFRITESKLINECVYADSITYNFPEKRFSGMLTSPPYPNAIDYSKMFAAENFFMAYLERNNKLSFPLIYTPIIGTNAVSGRVPGIITTNIANKFIYNLQTLKLKKDARYDMNNYYIPYFTNYFYDMEKAYENISKALSDDFIGYIVISENAIRNIKVPVSDFIVELWNRLGFEAQKIKDKEITHVGTKNPHAKGKMARHTEYIVKVWRGSFGNK